MSSFRVVVCAFTLLHQPCSGSCLTMYTTQGLHQNHRYHPGKRLHIPATVFFGSSKPQAVLCRTRLMRGHSTVVPYTCVTRRKRQVPGTAKEGKSTSTKTGNNYSQSNPYSCVLPSTIVCITHESAGRKACHARGNTQWQEQSTATLLAITGCCGLLCSWQCQAFVAFSV